MTLAPIALFTYNRLRHTRQTIEALRKNELAGASGLFVFSDGPRTESDIEKVHSVREYLKTVGGFHNVTVIERDRNHGLAQSIISGVTEVVDQHGQVIVLEDDLVTSPYFLKFMNEALDFYKDEERIISIHGYIYPVKGRLPETFFLKGADCLGWATWKRGWNLFEPDGRRLLYELKARNLTRRFNFDGTYSYTGLLKDQIAGKNQSWAVRWYASAFLNDKLTLYPGKSLVYHTGADGSGTHCAQDGEGEIGDSGISNEPVRIKAIPINEDRSAREEIKKYFRSIRPTLLAMAAGRIKRMLAR
jgi:hypothetical protein